MDCGEMGEISGVDRKGKVGERKKGVGTVGEK